MRGHNQTETAEIVGVDKSTISRELCRNRGEKGYRPKQAHQMVTDRRQAKAKPRIADDDWRVVERLLREDWSPEQISLWLTQEQRLGISHEWIYQYVLADKRHGGDLHRHLRCQKARKKRYGAYDRRGQLPNRVSIDERPAIVERRTRLGDWELDTIIGKGHKQAIVSLTERKSRLALIAKVATKEPAKEPPARTAKRTAPRHPSASRRACTSSIRIPAPNATATTTRRNASSSVRSTTASSRWWRNRSTGAGAVPSRLNRSV